MGTSSLNIQMKGKEIVYVLNQLYQDGPTRKQALRSSSNGSGIGIFSYENMEAFSFRFILPVWCSTCLLLTLVFALIIPPEGFFFADFIFSQRNENLFASYFLIFLQASLTVAGSSSYALFVTYSSISILRNSFWLHHARNDESDLREKLRVYNRMRIFNIHINASYIAILLPVYVFCFSGVIVAAGFGCIRLHGKTSMISYSIFLLLTFSCIAFNALFLLGFALCWNDSCAALSDMKAIFPAKMKKFYRKTLFATREYGIYYGPFRAVKHKHVFDSYEAIVNYLVTFLVS